MYYIVAKLHSRTQAFTRAIGPFEGEVSGLEAAREYLKNKGFTSPTIHTAFSTWYHPRFDAEIVYCDTPEKFDPATSLKGCDEI